MKQIRNIDIYLKGMYFGASKMAVKRALTQGPEFRTSTSWEQPRVVRDL